MSGYSESAGPGRPEGHDDVASSGQSSRSVFDSVSPETVAALLQVEDVEYILESLARGHTDDAIARSLGISTRTINRRMTRIMEAVDARTRFQLGIRLTPELRDTLRSSTADEPSSRQLRTIDRLRRQVDRAGKPVRALVWLWLDPIDED
jgi:hypothetical protein